MLPMRCVRSQALCFPSIYLILAIGFFANVAPDCWVAADETRKNAIVPDDVWPNSEQPQLKHDPDFNKPARVEQRFKEVADPQNRDNRARASALSDAVLKNDRALARLLLSRGAAVDLSGKESVYGLHPLGAALINNDSEAVEFLLNAGATPSLQCLEYMTGKTPAKTQAKITTLFLKAGLDPGQPELLHRFARMAAPEAFALLFQYGAKIQESPVADTNGGQESILISSIANTEKVKICLDQGADPNRTSRLKHMSPLHAAAANGNAATIDVLIKHGANLNALDSLGRTPLDVAVEQGIVSPEFIGDFVDPGTVEALLRHGAKGSIATDVATGNLKALQTRKDKGMPIEFKSRDSQGVEDKLDLVELATAFRQADTLQWLLENGVRESKRVSVIRGWEDNPTREDMPAIVMAAHHRDVRCVEILLKHGADSNATTSNNIYLTRSWAPLHAVLRPIRPFSTGEFEMPSLQHELNEQQIAIVKLLVDAGADVTLIDGEGFQPLKLLGPNAAKKYASLFRKTSK